MRNMLGLATVKAYLVLKVSAGNALPIYRAGFLETADDLRELVYSADQDPATRLYVRSSCFCGISENSGGETSISFIRELLLCG